MRKGEKGPSVEAEGTDVETVAHSQVLEVAAEVVKRHPVERVVEEKWCGCCGWIGVVVVAGVVWLLWLGWCSGYG